MSIAAAASPHVVRPRWTDPGGVDPEEAFVASLASCHMLWFLSLAAKVGFIVDRYDDEAVGTLEKAAARSRARGVLRRQFGEHRDHG